MRSDDGGGSSEGSVEAGSTAKESQYQPAGPDRRVRLRASSRIVKRAIDVAGASVLAVLLAPLMIVVAIAIKIDSRGPALFHQERVGSKRVGRGGDAEWKQTTFRMHKFRSMVADADETLHREYTKSFVAGDPADLEQANAQFKLSDDLRITRVGRVLRRTSIDELPQLFNVLRGEMSLVGPRPVPTYEVAHYEPWQLERLNALPGMTGYWQVYGRGNVPFEDMMRMDIFYVRSKTLWLDIKILAMTIPAVLTGRGAK